MNKRNLSLEKYGISGKRYKELCGFCEQYPEWIASLEEKSLLKSQNFDGMPHAPVGNTSDTTADNAIDRYVIESKVELIRDCARLASDDMSVYIINSACYGKSYESMSIPMSRASFYDARRYFFFLLDKRKQ